MICETRNVTRADRSLREGIWRESYPNTGSIRELRSMTVGLIGFGAIGQLVAQRLQPFGCSIMVHDPYLDASVIERLGCIAVDKKTLLQESDIVSLHGRIGPNDPPIIGRGIEAYETGQLSDQYGKSGTGGYAGAGGGAAKRQHHGGCDRCISEGAAD